ncbi:MAG: leucine-rich repeat protein [Mycoplasma sp.]
MYKISFSRTQPFWTMDNDNRPSKKLFDEWCDLHLEEDYNKELKFNGKGVYELEVVCKFESLKYIRLENEKNPKDVRFFHLSDFNFNSGGVYSYKFSLDIYATYTLDFLEMNKDSEVTFLRTHKYDPKCLQVEDGVMDSIPKYYDSYKFEKKLFNYHEFEDGRKVWYGNPENGTGEYIGIEASEVGDLNSNMYYVFSNGAEGKYRILPVLSLHNSKNVYVNKESFEKKLESETFVIGDAVTGKLSRKWYQVKDGLNDKVASWYNGGFGVSYESKSLNPNYSNGSSSHDWIYTNTDFIELAGIPRGALPVDFSVYTSGEMSSVKPANQRVKCQGSEIKNIMSGYLITANLNPNRWLDETCYDVSTFRVNKWEKKSGFDIKKVDNFRYRIEEYRKESENINKFLGVFHMPHVLTMKNFNFMSYKGGELIYIDIEAGGEFINNFGIYSYSMSNTDGYINNNSFSSPYLLKYSKIKYHGSDVSVEFRTNDLYDVFLGGKFYFTDKCYLISKNSDLVNLDGSVIEYGGTLPVASDEYAKYVASTRDVIDTGYNIAKQEAGIREFENKVGVASGVIESMYNGNSVGSPVIGAVNSGLNLLSGGFGLYKIRKGLKWTEERIRSQYSQAEKNMGNKILSSNIMSASMVSYYNDNSGDQYDGVEIARLNESSLILINNYILLYGYMFPHLSTYSKEIEYGERFNYIQIDSIVLDNMLNIKYDNNVLNNSVYDHIKDELTKGIRIWKTSDMGIPEYDEQYNKPDRPNILPPKPPVEWVESVYFKFNEETKTITGLKDEWKNKEIKDLVIEGKIGYDSVINVGNRAFDENEFLVGGISFEEGNRIEVLGDYVFQLCSNLNGNLDLTNLTKLKRIGRGVFNYCHNLTGSVDLSRSKQLTEIGNNAFFRCNKLNGVLNLSGLVDLTRIGDFAFSHCSKLTGNLDLSSLNNLKTIGELCFLNCYGFNGRLSLPNYLERISESAFENCSKLTGNLDLSKLDDLVGLGRYAFRGCSGLSGSVKLPKNLNSIGNNVFSGCNGLSEIICTNQYQWDNRNDWAGDQVSKVKKGF